MFQASLPHLGREPAQTQGHAVEIMSRLAWELCGITVEEVDWKREV